MPLSIAIDGPVGAGKSTLSDEVARRLNILHLDTGAMYRAVGLAALERHIDPADEEKVCRMLREQVELSVAYADGAQRTLLNGRDVSDRIRTQQVGGAASLVSRYAQVRHAMVALQRQIASRQDMLLDGRDIGTVVLPDAQVKIFLTASSRVRAERRMHQLRLRGDQTPYEDILSEVEQRDRQDMNRAVDPLRQAADAVLLDSSGLSFDETVQAILQIVEAKHGTSNRA